MKINIYGRVGKRLENNLITAANFYADVLLGKRLSKNIYLDIEIEKRFGDDSQGECCNDEFKQNPRNFTIRLSRSGSDDILKTLAHEMVHLKQYAKNELSHSYRPNFLTKSSIKFDLEITWKGKIWKPKKKEHEYWDSPWELEAYAREPGLYHRYLELSKS